MTVAMNADQRDLSDPREYDTRRLFIGRDFLVKTSLFICALKTSQGAEVPLFFVFAVFGGADELRVIRAPVFGRAYSAAPTRFHAHLNQLLRNLGGEGRKYFDFKSDVVLNELTDLRDIWTAKEAEAFAIKYWEIIADSLSKAGWSWGCVSAIDSYGRTIWIADAHRDDGRRSV
jgi:hypothetical protein